jgi:hypothetical protein
MTAAESVKRESIIIGIKREVSRISLLPAQFTMNTTATMYAKAAKAL